MDKMRRHPTPSPEAMSKQPTERTAVMKDAGPANDQGAGAETWDSEGLGNMASGTRRAQSTSQHFPRAIQRRRCDGLILQAGNSHVMKEDITPSECHSPGPAPSQPPNLLISGPSLPNAVVCTKEAISAFLLQTVYFCLPSRKGTSTKNWIHLSYQSFPHYKLAFQFLTG